MRGIWATVALGAFVVLATASAQQHSHGTGEAFVAIAHDAPPDGRAVVGQPAHFAALFLGEDGAPRFHENMVLTVELNGAVLYQTTPASGHDYDGVNPFAVVFPVPGSYVVRAATEDGAQAAEFRGYVVEDPGAPATLQLDLPEAAGALAPVTIAYAIVDAAGQPLEHSDVVLEVRRLADQALVFRAHTHGHDGQQALTYTFARPGAYEVTLLAYQAYPSEGAAMFPAFTTARRVEVAPGLPALEAPMPLLPAGPPAQEINVVTLGTAEGEYALLGTYDPYTVTGPFGQARLSALLLNSTAQPVQHVNFQATLLDPLGRTVFESATLHEYDGILEVLAGAQEPGPYRLLVKAQRGAWEGEVVLDYTVAPPAAPLSAGPQFLQASGLDALQAGTPAEVELFMHDLAGRPFAHSEVDVQVVRAAEGAVPALATKLHTHGDGRFPFTLALPEPGDYVLRLAPFSLEPRPTPEYYGAELGDPLLVPFSVGEGPGLPAALPLQATSEQAPRAPTPGLELGAALAGLAVAALAARRR